MGAYYVCVMCVGEECAHGLRPVVSMHNNKSRVWRVVLLRMSLGCDLLDVVLTDRACVWVLGGGGGVLSLLWGCIFSFIYCMVRFCWFGASGKI